MKAALGLGTVQFGLGYGIANAGAEVSHADLSAILAAARGHGIALLDTAAQYGASEARLGRQDLGGFRIVTKSVSLADRSPADAGRAVIEGARSSIDRLGVDHLDGFLVHNADDLLGPAGPEVRRALGALKASGLAAKVGVSIYDAAQIDAVLAGGDVDIVQLPVNVLDQRLVRSGAIAALADRGIEVHARSAYLQGLLLMDSASIPAHFACHDALRRWHEAARGLTPLEAALAFVRDLPGVDVVLVGAVTVAQIAMTAEAFARAAPFDAAGLASDDIDLIDPRRWPRR